MFTNIYYDTKKSTIHLWEENGKHTKHKWVPYVFVEGNGDSVKTIDGKSVVKKEFDTYSDYYAFCKETKAYENNIRPEIQFLADKYHHIPDEMVKAPQMKIYYIDIEVNFGNSLDINRKIKVRRVKDNG